MLPTLWPKIQKDFVLTRADQDTHKASLFGISALNQNLTWVVKVGHNQTTKLATVVPYTVSIDTQNISALKFKMPVDSKVIF